MVMLFSPSLQVEVVPSPSPTPLTLDPVFSVISSLMVTFAQVILPTLVWSTMLVLLPVIFVPFGASTPADDVIDGAALASAGAAKATAAITAISSVSFLVM